MRWVRVEDAPSTLSFVEDQMIVEKALSAIPCLDPAPSIGQLHDWYLDSSIDARALGFLCISLGGSLLYGQQDDINPQEIGNLTD